MNRPWIEDYPPGVPADLPELGYRSLADLFAEAFKKHAGATAFHSFGAKMSFGELDEASDAFGAYMQSLGLKPGDRVALMMPNVFQYPVAVAGLVRAGLVVVNTNPLYTSRELEHQLNDSGAKAIVVLENMASTLATCRERTGIEHVIVARMGDMLPTLKGALVNFVVKRVKKLVPAYEIADAVAFNDAMKKGRNSTLAPASTDLDDVAVLQYTGGTTGVAKGATLTHRNVISNVLQSEYWYEPALKTIPEGQQAVMVCALPLYHIFGFTVNMMLSVRKGAANILIPNPRDIPALLRALKGQVFHSFPAVNTLFGAIARHSKAREVDWSHLLLSVGGGMAVQRKTSELWQELTGCPICEGYGLSETAPVASCNRTDGAEFTGTIGLPLPSTEMRILAEDGSELGPGEPGEIVIRGPQVMKGYWNRPEDTAKAFTQDGFFRSGDIGIVDERGYFRIVDRKKDMINVSGFNVYPNEIEDIVTGMPGVTEAAAVAMEHEESGEAVKLFVVRSDPSLTEEAVKAYCRERLTGYKRPRAVVFKDELPKSGVGKILRRELRE